MLGIIGTIDVAGVATKGSLEKGLLCARRHEIDGREGRLEGQPLFGTREEGGGSLATGYGRNTAFPRKYRGAEHKCLGSCSGNPGDRELASPINILRTFYCRSQLIRPARSIM